MQKATESLVLRVLSPRGEAWLLFTLAAIQFTHIVDFMVMMPLGPPLTRAFGLSTAQFGFLVSSYTLAAAVSGFLASFYMDRFGRRRLLVVLYVGFAVATLACALAPTFAALVAARMLAGAFGGVLGALVQTIIGDVIPYERRAKAMGMVMAAFALSTVLGVPGSLMLANALDWHAPFFVIGVASLGMAFVATRTLPPLRAHLALAQSQSAWANIKATLAQANHWRAFGLVALMNFGGFVIVPYITLANVGNGVIAQSDLPIAYFVGGFATFFTARLIGGWADQYGKARVFCWVSLGAMPMMVVMTRMVPMPLWAVVAVFMLFFVFVPGRMTPGMALVTGAADPRLRGTFMSLSSSVQQLASGVAAFVGGAIVSTDASGRVLHYPWVALVAVCATALAMWVAWQVRAPDSKPG